jgi:hypothetical protein
VSDLEHLAERAPRRGCQPRGANRDCSERITAAADEPGALVDEGIDQPGFKGDLRRDRALAGDFGSQCEACDARLRRGAMITA